MFWCGSHLLTWKRATWNMLCRFILKQFSRFGGSSQEEVCIQFPKVFLFSTSRQYKSNLTVFFFIFFFNKSIFIISPRCFLILTKPLTWLVKNENTAIFLDYKWTHKAYSQFRMWMTYKIFTWSHCSRCSIFNMTYVNQGQQFSRINWTISTTAKMCHLTKRFCVFCIVFPPFVTFPVRLYSASQVNHHNCY